MPVNWLGSRSNLDLTREEPVTPCSPGFEEIDSTCNTSSTNRRIFVNIPVDEHFKDRKTSRPYLVYKTNKVRTSKYTIVTFLPKNIFEQFRGIANFYFLSLVILQVFNDFKEVDVSVTAAPILIIVAITAFKDAIEDWKRHESDNSINKSFTYVMGNWNNSNFQAPSESIVHKISSFFKWIQRSMTKGVLFIIVLITGFTKILKQARLSRTGTSKSPVYPNQIYAHDYISQDHLNLVAASLDTLKNPGLPKLDSKPHLTEPWNLNRWENVKVGDFVFLRNNDNIPADMIIVSSSEPDSACYVETKNLDGETNLKIKRGVQALQNIRTPEDCRSIRCHIDSEPPNANLYTYTGTMVLRTGTRTRDSRANRSAIPMSTNNVLLRGCVVRNTHWVIGIVVYTGEDTKIMLNSGATPSKRSKIDRQINPQILLNFAILTGMCLICGLVSGFYSSSFAFEVSPFEGTLLENIEPPLRLGILSFFRCMIIFQNIIPIALYISLDVTKTFQSFMIHLDEDMYDEESGKYVLPQSWNLCDDLGQIEYIFSDKTGTLTSNTMEFRKASINGITYGVMGAEAHSSSNPGQTPTETQESRFAEEAQAMRNGLSKLFDTKYVSSKLAFIDSRIPKHLQDGTLQARKIREFFTLLAICHTVLIEKPDKSNPSRIVYNAQSPDEAALVSAAKDTGFACLRRVDNEVEIDVLGISRKYTILNIIEFNSDRKRMSVLVRRPEGEIILMCKGADSMIYERLSHNNDPAILEATANHLASYANDGLRTLCLAYRLVPEEEYQEWAAKYAVAQAKVDNREAECDAVAELIEHDLTLMGATAIEDKLQEGVPECIATLSKAGIKIWVLTGDKMETAVNIGFSCNLLKRSMTLIVIKSKSIEDSILQIKEALTRFWNPFGSPMDGREYGLIIDGESLKFALDPVCRPILLELGCRCCAVVCCRVSPLQKAMVVQLVRKGLSAMCLAIGDGANDVSMIQEADIGVGISGKEGLQAVMASDYAISQFRFLSRLLLVHGRWAYLRSSKLVLNYFYKNTTWLFILFWHQFFCTFSAGLITDFTYSMFFNTVFTFLPTILIGCFDQDVNDYVALQVPEIYVQGIYQTLYNMRQYWSYVLDAMYQSIVCYFFAFLVFEDKTLHPGGLDSGLESMGTTVAFSSILLVNIYAIVDWSSWTYITIVALLLTIGLWIMYVLIYASQVTSQQYGIISVLFHTPAFYLCVVLSIVVGLFPRVMMKFVQQYFAPTDVDIVREIQQYQWKKGMVLSLDTEESSKDSLHDSTTESLVVSADPTHKLVKRNRSEMQLQTAKTDIASVNITRAKSDDQLQTTAKDEPQLPPKQTIDAIVDSTGYVIPTESGVNASTDGFGYLDVKRKTTPHGLLDGSIETRSRRTSLSSVIKTSVNRASQFVRRIAHPIPSPGVQLSRSARASSLVYMGDNGGQVANTGFAFSHDTGMSEVITPTSRTTFDVSRRTTKRIPGKGRAPSNTGTLRNLSTRLHNVLHIGSRSPMTSVDIAEAQKQQQTSSQQQSQQESVDQIVEDPREESEGLALSARSVQYSRPSSLLPSIITNLEENDLHEPVTKTADPLLEEQDIQNSDQNSG
ncbi:phospholipid transporting ATPase [Batrachochytrium dendrobatidis]|nr:phospholipid transporting ATPase [Batrachochytrium dendrobatidis]